METKVTKYADALVSIAKEEKKLVQYKNAAKDFDILLQSNLELKKALESYFISKEEKFLVIDEIVKDDHLDNWTNFLKIITEKHIIFEYHELSKEIIFSINEELGIYDGFVYSVKKLDEKTIQNIERSISKRMGVKVELTNLLDERLIGGVKVVVHDHVFDGSVLHKIDEMKHEIIERRVQ